MLKESKESLEYFAKTFKMRDKNLAKIETSE